MLKTIQKLHINQVQDNLNIINKNPGLFSAYDKALHETVLADFQDHEIGFDNEYSQEELEDWLNALADEYKRNLKTIVTDYSSKKYLKEK